jgi:KDO2-lipid IV(A) lauroyltransferase
MGFKLFLLLEKFLMKLPHSVRKSFFIFLAKVAKLLSAKTRKVVKANLEFVFKDITKEQIDSITDYSFKNLLLNFLHLMEIRHMSKDDLAKIVKIENLDEVKRIHNEGRAIVYVTTHYSSWELGGASIGAFIEPLGAVYKRMKNKDYENWVLESRSYFGNINLEKTNVMKKLIKLVKEKKSIGILIDTKIPSKDGVIVDFLGKKISQTSAASFLARKYNAAIVPVAMRTDDDENYTLMIFNELKIENSDDVKKDIEKLTQLQATWLSELIKKEPKFWFWLHRRFKGEYPEIYL